MIGLLCFVLAVLGSPFKSKMRLEAENAVLQHQLIVLRRRLHGCVRLAFRAVADLLNQPAKEKRRCIKLFSAAHPFGKEIGNDLADNCGLTSDRYPRQFL
jgi:hypothetical protein